LVSHSLESHDDNLKTVLILKKGLTKGGTMFEFMYTNLLTLTIFVMGSLTVVISLVVAYKFSYFKKHLEGKPKELAKAVAWQLLGEAVIGFGTLVFTSAAFFGVLSSWSIEVQSGIRFVMFFATSVTTVHLMLTLKKLSD
jgi:hypothetical protein